MESIEAWPLAWPSGRKRTSNWDRERAKFEVTFARARDNVIQEVTRLAGRYPDPEIIISTNIALRRDGYPLANQRQPEDTGVAVYFTYKKRPMSFACDRWQKIEHNMQAIAKTIEALRGIARWGTGDMLEAAFTGFTALPAPNAGRPWREVMIFADSTPTREQLEQRWRDLRSSRHPDKGGTAAAFAELQAAYEDAKGALGG